MIVSDGGYFLPFYSCPGGLSERGMVSDEIDSRIKCIGLESYDATLLYDISDNSMLQVMFKALFHQM